MTSYVPPGWEGVDNGSKCYTKALSRIWSFSSELWFAPGGANLQHERKGFDWELEIGDLTESSCCPCRAVVPVQKENEWLMMLRMKLPIVLCRLMCLHERFPFCSFLSCC